MKKGTSVTFWIYDKIRIRAINRKWKRLRGNIRQKHKQAKTIAITLQKQCIPFLQAQIPGFAF